MKFRYLLLITVILLSLFACEDSTCPDVVMATPSNLSLEQLDWSSIQLTWQDNTTRENHYQIDRRVGEGDWEVQYQVLAENSISFIDSNLIEMGNYSYRVLGYNNEESSGFTEATYYFMYNEVHSIYPANEDLVLIYPEETIEYQVNLVDASDELVERDYLVWFELLSAPVGTNINGLLFNDTDSLSVQSLNGIATINLTGGTEEGEILLKSYTYNSTGEEVAADLVAYVDNQYPEVAVIEILTADQIALGTNDSVTIRADLKDEFGDIVLEEYEVFVEFLGRPEGTNLNNIVYELGEFITIPTVQGRAVFSLNSGVVSGNVGIRIYTYNSAGEEILVEKSNILVTASAPAYCELYHGGVNEGEDVGNGFWRISLNAYLADILGNPVQDGTSVLFTLPNNPVSATIEIEYAFVGNINDAEPGYAYNFLTYDGAYTNDIVTVRIQAGDFTQDYEVVLPLQNGYLAAISAPYHYEWTEDDNPEYKDIEIRLMLRDGQGNQINGQVLEFSTTHGTPLEPSPPDTGDPWSGLTGPGTGAFEGQSGMLSKYIRVYKNELPAPNPDPVTVEVNIQVNVADTDIDTIATVILTRIFD